MNNNLQLSNLQKMHMKKINTAEKTAYKAEQFYKKKPGPSCSKLTMLLVKVSLKL